MKLFSCGMIHESAFYDPIKVYPDKNYLFSWSHMDNPFFVNENYITINNVITHKQYIIYPFEDNSLIFAHCFYDSNSIIIESRRFSLDEERDITGLINRYTKSFYVYNFHNKKSKKIILPKINGKVLSGISCIDGSIYLHCNDIFLDSTSSYKYIDEKNIKLVTSHLGKYLNSYSEFVIIELENKIYLYNIYDESSKIEIKCSTGNQKFCSNLFIVKVYLGNLVGLFKFESGIYKYYCD